VAAGLEAFGDARQLQLLSRQKTLVPLAMAGQRSPYNAEIAAEVSQLRQYGWTSKVSG
jgi:hypothetical protein